MRSFPAYPLARVQHAPAHVQVPVAAGQGLGSVQVGVGSAGGLLPLPRRWPVSFALRLQPVGLDYWILPRRTSRLGSSLSDHFSCLPARALSAELPDGADPAPGIQGCRALGTPARERGLAPSDRPGPVRAGRPAVARGTVAIGSTPSVGGGVHSDPGDPARLAPAAGRTQMGLHQPAASPTAVHGSRGPQARDPHGDGEPHVGAPAGARRTSESRPSNRGLHCLAYPPLLRPRPPAPPHPPD